MFITPQKVKKSIKDPKKLKQVDSWKKSDLSKVSSSIHKKQRASFEITTEFLDNCINFQKDDIEFMLKLGVDIDCSDKDNLTALHQACINGKLELVEYLLSKNANINVIDTEGWTPLHIAASIGSLELAKFLIDKGARLDLVNYEGDLPIALVDSEHEELKKYLQKEMNKRNINEELCRYMERNVMMEDVLKWKSTGVYEPPMDESIKFTPLHVAASKNYLDVLTELTPLLSKDDLNAQDSDGWTALHAAAHWGNREACIILVKAGADLDIVTKANETVIDIMDPEIKESLEGDLRQFQMENLRTIADQVTVRNEVPNKRSMPRTSMVRQSIQMKKYTQSKDPVMERQIHEAAQISELTSTSSYTDDENSPRLNNIDSNKHDIQSIFEGDESSLSSKPSRDSYENKSHSTISVTSPLNSFPKEGTTVSGPSSDVHMKEQSEKSSLELDFVATHPVSRGDIDNEAVAAHEDTNVHNSVNDNNAAICNLPYESDQSINDTRENVIMRPKSVRDPIIERRKTTNRLSLVMAPSKCDESESNRREKARRIRSNRRSTQGINLATVEFLKNRQNEIVNGGLEQEPDSPIPEESAVDVIDATSTNDQASDIVVDNSIVNTTVVTSSSPQQPQNDSTFSNIVPKYRITNALGSFLKSKPSSNNNAHLNTITKPDSLPSSPLAVVPSVRFDSSKPSGPVVTEYKPTVPHRSIVTDITNVNKEPDSGSFVARSISGITRMKNNDTPIVPSQRSSGSAVLSTKHHPRFQNSISLVDDYKQPCRTIVDSLTNKEIVIKEQNIEIAKLKLKILELENSQRSGAQPTKNIEDETELARIRKENETLKTQNESLLRVIGKIQQELHLIHPLSLNN